MIVPPRHPAGQGSGTTATRARGGPGGLPTEDLASLSVSKKLSHGSPLAAGCQAALCPGATALSRLWAQALSTETLGLCRGCMAALPPGGGDPLFPAEPGAGSGTGASDLMGEGQGLGQEGGQDSLSPVLRCRSPFIRLLAPHGFGGLFKGSGTVFHMYLWGSGWQVGMVDAGSEPLPLPASLPPLGASLGTFVI